MAPPSGAYSNSHHLPTSGNLCICLDTVRHVCLFSRCAHHIMFSAADCDRVNIHTLARWEAPTHMAAPASVHSKVTLTAKKTPASPGLDTAPTVSAGVQTLARALPSASRLVRPTSQGPSPRHVPAQQPRPLPTLPPLPPPQEPTLAAAESVRDASSPQHLSTQCWVLRGWDRGCSICRNLSWSQCGLWHTGSN